MPTNKQRRQAAQRHLQRQLERRAELAQQAPPQPRHPRDRARRRRGGRRRAADHRRAQRRRRPERRRRRQLEQRPPRPAAAARRTNADGTTLHLRPGRLGQPEPHRRRHAADPEATPDPGHRRPADEHQPGRPHADPGPDEGPVRGGQLHLPRRQEVLRRHPLPPHGQPAEASACCSAATRPAPAPAARRYKYAEEVTAGDDLPARHDRDGEHRRARHHRQPVLPLLQRHPARRRTTPSSARSTRPASPCSTPSPPAATTARSSPSRRRRPEHPGHDRVDDRRRLNCSRRRSAVEPRTGPLRR